MLTVGAVVERLLPNGSAGSGKRIWKSCPIWAPDVFAVAATIAETSGCYAEPGVALSRDAAERSQKLRRATAARDVGQRWADNPTPPPLVKKAWAALIQAWDESLSAAVGEGPNWKRAALDLLAIADEACSGVGYAAETDSSPLSSFVFRQFVDAQKGDDTVLAVPTSICMQVPSERACVLPKALTPEVGCTLRSLSHNLALLPGRGSVRPEWYIGSLKSDYDAGHSYNLLLVPFPFVVFGTDFKKVRVPEAPADGYFAVSQGWLKTPTGDALSQDEFSRFVIELIEIAEADSGPVHGLIFPEAALTWPMAEHLAGRLSETFPALELVICGTLSDDAFGATRNEAIVIRLDQGIAAVFRQAKHHRWKLTSSQIVQYQLGGILDVRSAWWEAIDVSSRRIQFGLNRHQALVAALVCEDLARFDPVMPILTAVGPNLVVALLMDGPQLEQRWSGRYATALAEDPGSSVLTVTSLGMVLRSRPPGEDNKRVVGLWKDQVSSAIPLTLPIGSHGVLLALTIANSEQRTLDLRRDGGAVVNYRLGGIRSVTHTRPPAWLERKAR